MRKFVCYFNNSHVMNVRCPHVGDEHEKNIANKCFEAATRLVNLTHMTIDFGSALDVNVTVHDVSTLMDNFTCLVHLKLRLPLAASHILFDQKVDQLVRKNPGLRLLLLAGVTLSDAALTSVSRLPDLQDLRLATRVMGGFTVNGVLTLLKSHLRSPLLVARFAVHEMSGEGRKKLDDEIALIAVERGKTLTGLGDKLVKWGENVVSFEFQH